ncbi:hypothetical protein [Streptomyces sp. NPDC002676]
MSANEVQVARDLVRACALGSGDLPAPRSVQLLQALWLSDEVIRASVALPHPAEEADQG